MNLLTQFFKVFVQYIIDDCRILDFRDRSFACRYECRTRVHCRRVLYSRSPEYGILSAGDERVEANEVVQAAYILPTGLAIPDDTVGKRNLVESQWTEGEKRKKESGMEKGSKEKGVSGSLSIKQEVAVQVQQ